MFDWDPQKAKANQLKHGVSFEEAATAFLDPDGLDGEDLEHSLQFRPDTSKKGRRNYKLFGN
jgi:uncharacterized DUF497 family protein